MNREQISALMDGELDEARVRTLCAQLKSEESSDCWAAYHLIGDALRNECLAQSGFAQRFAQRLAAEPTVLAPGSKSALEGGGFGWPASVRARPWYYGMAAAASIAAVGLVGWFGMQEFNIGPGLREVAAARTPGTVMVGAADTRATGTQANRRLQTLGINPYLFVHQEYSPTTAMQGVRPYVRTVADMAASE